ncbi:MAG: dTDP-4-dehydrorhamnose reductase [Azoarcus sp.]|jgi:dTDP-4-dehydrorhamnose reductase|nr:dTDP-4-dehydrorhamnose reductase [Azoarcus sp.]
MKILLLGKSGQLGWELQRALAPLGDVMALGLHSSGGLVGDLGDEAGLRATIAAVAPDIIVNAAAYTAVDRAESEPELAYRINAGGPAVLAAEAAARGIWLLHYSTDYVYDGSGSRPWREDDAPRPLSVYGKTKLVGDEAILACGCPCLILRTSWVYAARGSNFARTVLNLAAERETLSMVADQIGAPTGADLIADVSAHLLRSVTRDGNAPPCGVYHLVAAGETSWYDYARLVIDEARKHSLSIKAKNVVPILSEAWKTPAVRPLNSRLDTTRLRTCFDIRLPDWREGVERLVHEILQS